MSDKTGRKPLISGNWKMNLDHFEAIRAVQKLAYLLTSEDFDVTKGEKHAGLPQLIS